MKDQVRALRKSLNLSQGEFAESIGLTKNYISLVETGKRSLADRTIRDICRMYSVNEHWLRTGEGEPYIKGSEDELAELVGRLYKDKGSMRYKMSLELCRSMEKMTDEQLMAFAEFVKRLAEAATSEE
nr:MAG TPA: helix-turn-helix domain protein [Caudoviricetes sp.]